MKKKKKAQYKWKKQDFFNFISLIFILTIGFYFLGRLIYYKIDSTKKNIYSQILYKHLIEQNDTYENSNFLNKVNSTYYYVNKADNNYVQFKGYLWRILRINKDNSITMVTEDNVSTLAYSTSFENNILNWLNQTDDPKSGIFEKSLEDENKILESNKLCLDKIKDVEGTSCFKIDDDYKIGIISLDDYIKAGADKSYLNNKTSFWTSNNYSNGKAWIINEDGRLSYVDNSSKHGIRPVITISGNLEIIKGTGISDDPFILENKTVKQLNDIYIGNYLTFNDTLWKVISKEKDKIKIASTSCLQDENGNCIEKSFSNYYNSITPSNTLIKYLNTEYYNSIKEKDALTEGSFDIGTYSLDTNDYHSALTDTINLKVGFLSMADIYAYDVPNTFLFTKGFNNDSSIYCVNEKNSLYETMANQSLNIRPVIYLKNNLTITSGNGSYLDPYTIGGIDS